MRIKHPEQPTLPVLKSQASATNNQHGQADPPEVFNFSVWPHLQYPRLLLLLFAVLASVLLGVESILGALRFTSSAYMCSPSKADESTNHGWWVRVVLGVTLGILVGVHFVGHIILVVLHVHESSL